LTLQRAKRKMKKSLTRTEILDAEDLMELTELLVR
jgi:hypothetical protein